MTIDTVLSIADEFSEPLLRLSKTALESGSAVETLNQALEFGKEYVTDYVESLKDSAIGIKEAISDELNPGIKDLIDTVGSAGNSIIDVFGASEIASSISEITNLAIEMSTPFDAFVDSMSDQKDIVVDFVYQTADTIGLIGDEIRNSLIPSVLQAKDSFVSLGSATKDMFLGFDANTAKAFAIALADAGLSSVKVAKESTGIIGSIYGAVSFVKNFRWKFLEAVSMGAFNRLKGAYIKAFANVKQSIERSLDDLTITDKLNSMYGEAGKVAKDRAYKLANELGQDARTITSMSMTAAYQGIGTEDFERMMKLSDKINKLGGTDQDLGSIAQAIMSNIRGDQSADSIAQMFGGGHIMEKILKNKGYERALHRGDVQEALKIAEEIAEKSGLTDENYQKATETLSNNYKRIQNNVENFRQRISEMFANSFAPAVKKVKDFLESERFKRIQSIVEFLIQKIGDFANDTIIKMIDNIEWLGVFLGIGIITKTVLLIKSIKKIIFLLSTGSGILGFIGKRLMLISAHMTKIGIKQTAILIKQKAIAALKVAGPWLLAGAAIGAATYGVYKYLGVSKSFGGWLMGMLAAAYKYWTNVTQNMFVWICEKLPLYFNEAITTIQANFFELLGSLKKKFGEFIASIYEALGKAAAAMGFEELAQGHMNVAMEVKGWGSDALGKAAGYRKEIEDIKEQLKLADGHMIDVWEGTEEAYETEGASVKEWLKKLFKQNEEQTKEQKGIKSDSSKIRQMQEQEEELKWLKLFSDRQIMSSINNSTSNSRTLIQNGVPAAVMSESSRRISTMPSRGLL